MGACVALARQQSRLPNPSLEAYYLAAAQTRAAAVAVDAQSQAAAAAVAVQSQAAAADAHSLAVVAAVAA